MVSMTQAGELKLTVNGEKRRVFSRPSDLLMYTLREALGLTGVKPGCENGDCGACTVLADGVPMKSCMMLTAEASGKSLTTVEGLNRAPAQEAFIRRSAFQCGYCTSGFLMVAHALAQRHPGADAGRIQEWLRSNICRCTGYEEIGAAVRDVVSAH